MEVQEAKLDKARAELTEVSLRKRCVFLWARGGERWGKKEERCRVEMCVCVSVFCFIVTWAPQKKTRICNLTWIFYANKAWWQSQVFMPLVTMDVPPHFWAKCCSVCFLFEKLGETEIRAAKEAHPIVAGRNPWADKNTMLIGGYRSNWFKCSIYWCASGRSIDGSNFRLLILGIYVTQYLT